MTAIWSQNKEGRMSEFDLSKKIFVYDGEDEDGNPKMQLVIAGSSDNCFVKVGDVKEFIRRLKEIANEKITEEIRNFEHDVWHF